MKTKFLKVAMNDQAFKQNVHANDFAVIEILSKIVAISVKVVATSMVMATILQTAVAWHTHLSHLPIVLLLVFCAIYLCLV